MLTCIKCGSETELLKSSNDKKETSRCINCGYQETVWKVSDIDFKIDTKETKRKCRFCEKEFIGKKRFCSKKCWKDGRFGKPKYSTINIINSFDTNKSMILSLEKKRLRPQTLRFVTSLKKQLLSRNQLSNNQALVLSKIYQENLNNKKHFKGQKVN